MSPWLTFFISSLVLTLVAAGGILLHRHQHPGLETRRSAGDAQILYVSVWLASLSILAYIVFVFGKR